MLGIEAEHCGQSGYIITVAFTDGILKMRQRLEK
jgi:hypothetical protein